MKKVWCFFIDIIIVASFCVVSCKKNSTPLISKVKTATTSGRPTIYYSYDIQGRLTQDSTYNSVQNYTYNSSDSIIVSGWDTTNLSSGSDSLIRRTYSYAWLLNSQGLVTYNPIASVHYVYDSQNHLVLQYDTLTDTTNYAYYNGNCTMVTSAYSYGLGVNAATTNQFYTLILDSRDFGQPYFGVPSRDLISYWSCLNCASTSDSFAYTFDKYSRVTTQTQFFDNCCNITKTTYTYY